MIEVEYRESDWGGNVVFSREFYTPDTNNYLWIEAHETESGNYRIAHWVPDGDLGGVHDVCSLHQMLKYLSEYPVPDGMIEESIPAKTYNQIFPE